MGNVRLFVTLIFVIFVGNTRVFSVLAQEDQLPKCSEKTAKCRYSWECCTGCCNAEGLCDVRSETCAQDGHPCLSKTDDCSEGETCRLYPVACFVAPCPPLAMCLSPSNPNPCSNVTCDPGAHCELKQQASKNCPDPALCPPKAACVKDSTCKKSSCPSGSTCTLSGKRLICVPSCDRVPCPKGSRCSLQQVGVCRTDRCDLKPKCIRSGGKSN